MKISGVYKIRNRVNGKYYIGSSDNILGSHGRWSEHINGLKSNRHENSYLQRAWNKYGQENFEFSILEEVQKQYLLLTEQTYLDRAKLDGKKCYNLSYIAAGGGFAGHKHSEESKRKTSEKLKGRPSPMRGKKIPPEKNCHCDQNIYTFRHLLTNEIFTGTRYNFWTKYRLRRDAVSHLILGKSKSSYGWIVDPISHDGFIIAK